MTLLGHIARLLALLMLFGTIGYAKMVDGIAILVNGEPITLLEVYQTIQVSGLSKEKAIDQLVRQALEKAETKQMNITVDEFELDREAENIAQKNGLTLIQFKDILLQRGTKWSEFEEELRDKVKRDKLYQKIASAKIRQPDEEELRHYYQAHLETFSIPRKIELIKYAAETRKPLQILVQNPLYSSELISQEAEMVDTQNLNPQFVYLLTETSENSFTPIINVGTQYVTFFIQKKFDVKPIEFEMAKNAIYAKVMEEKRTAVVNDYFEKLKASAKVKVIRLS